MSLTEPPFAKSFDVRRRTEEQIEPFCYTQQSQHKGKPEQVTVIKCSYYQEYSKNEGKDRVNFHIVNREYFFQDLPGLLCVDYQGRTRYNPQNTDDIQYYVHYIYHIFPPKRDLAYFATSQKVRSLLDP